ncbi:MAG: hypothetical protein KJO36_04070 [Acidimicrobiia bacterium]|nr:hypothetical protein [Acidimicrobiia bacterium]MBT8249538.1 hypothetical protein [Acidimicrobiia bacterium]NNC42995.1 hypothetical protein [Acidimicrobiia bacterium]NND12596.1 hypothetical protein [Acidimicrobiia bacterium]NNL27711.1 hypothetical protein [Acidimicrobiia bacterium]
MTRIRASECAGDYTETTGYGRPDLDFVWSDDLAKELEQHDGIEAGALDHWILSPVGYRLPDDTTVLNFARELLEYERWLASSQAM